MTSPNNPDTVGSGEPNENAFPPVEELGYERARKELAETVSILERGQMSLDESLTYWERAEALVTYCEGQLSHAEERVEKALGDRDGGEDEAAAGAEEDAPF